MTRWLNTSYHLSQWPSYTKGSVTYRLFYLSRYCHYHYMITWLTTKQQIPCEEGSFIVIACSVLSSLLYQRCLLVLKSVLHSISMLWYIEQTFFPNPYTQRGNSTKIGISPDGECITYGSGTNVIVRNIRVRVVLVFVM